MRRETVSRGASAGGEALSGNHLPNPIPPRVRRHSSTAQTPAKACVTLEGACPTLSALAMPVVSYTGLGGGEQGPPSCFSRRPATTRHTRRRGPHPVPVGHTVTGPPPRGTAPRRARRDFRSSRTRRSRPDRRTARSTGPPPADAPPAPEARDSGAPRPIGRSPGPAEPRPRPRRHGPPYPPAVVRTRHDSRRRGSAPARPSGAGCAPGVTGYSTHNRWFSANFTWVPNPSADGRTAHRPPGRNGPRGTLSPDADGPRCRRALPCALRR